MRAVVITKHGDPDVLEVQERPSPQLKAGGVRIAVRAAGVNFADLMARLGLYPDAPAVPCVVGYEVAGEVTEVAGDVTDVEVGDRVVAGTRFGGYAEEVCVGRDDVVPLPDALSFEQGAAIPVNYATAWAGLLGYGSLRAGERVLVHAAAGGVGIAATQIAKRTGAEVYGTASPGKHEAITGFGVDVALDYTRSGWEKGLPPFDLVMDAIGGSSLKRSYDLLRPGGRLIAFGASSVVAGEKKNLLKAAPQALRMIRGFNAMDQMSDSKAVIGLNMLRLWDDRGTLEPWITPLRALIDDGTVDPVVSDVVPFDRAADAHRILTERRNIGKVVLVP
ncbi:zinc-binding dehydrogenase [Paraconexibacter sp.]|uniref:zinc-binding dehydrogenase n=1 Tax=Paraconexibacter sp. TaxID=2949640 RepID=UPI003564F9BC